MKTIQLWSICVSDPIRSKFLGLWVVPVDEVAHTVESLSESVVWREDLLTDGPTWLWVCAPHEGPPRGDGSCCWSADAVLVDDFVSGHQMVGVSTGVLAFGNGLPADVT